MSFLQDRFLDIIARKFVNDRWYRIRGFKAYEINPDIPAEAKLFPTSVKEDLRYWWWGKVPSWVFASPFFKAQIRSVPRKYRVSFATLEEQILAHSGAIVGFDVFDTLVRRHVAPEGVKDAVARHFLRLLQAEGVRDCPSFETLRRKRFEVEMSLGAANAKRGKDRTDAPLDKIIRAWVHLCYKGSGKQKMIKALVTQELLIEQQSQSPTPGIISTLESLKEAGKKLFFVSDIYYSKSQLKQLLSYHGLDDFFENGLCSCDYAETKHSGALFERFFRTFKLSPQAVTFVGDNTHSDYHQAIAAGMKAFCILDGAELKRNKQSLVVRDLAAKNPHWEGLVLYQSLWDRIEKAPNSVDHEMGRIMGAWLIPYFLFVLESLREKPIDHVFALSREGIFLAQIYERFQKYYPDLPSILPICASRLSTNLAAYETLSLEHLNRMWYQYPDQSFIQVCQNLKLNPTPFRAMAARYDFDISAPIMNPFWDYRFTQFLADGDTKQEFSRQRDQYMGKLRSYLDQLGFLKHKSIAMLDVGWKGTIQDNLFRGFGAQTDQSFTGLYLGYLTSDVEAGHPRNQKKGYFVDKWIHHYAERSFFENNSLFEMLLSDQTPSTKGYVTDHGKVRPDLEKNVWEYILHHQHTEKAQQGIFEIVDAFLEHKDLLNFTAAPLRSFAVESVRHFHHYPTLPMAKNIEHYYHFENFGVHYRTNSNGQRPVWKIMLTSWPWHWKQRVLEQTHGKMWAAAYIKRQKMPGLSGLYDWNIFKGFRGF